MRIPFNKPYVTGNEFKYISEAIDRSHVSGDGEFTKKCNAWIEKRLGVRKALLTHSCTAALEMSAILAGIGPGDEVIMPSFTFVSTATAFALRGGVPVFVDIRPDTLNIDEAKIEEAMTPRTRAIVAVHYAGVGCEMEPIMEIAGRHGLFVIDDAAHGVLAAYRGRQLGSFGHLGAVSFHETKNVISGEGGAILVNDERYAERAEIIREKGTNRTKFFRGEIGKYEWVDIGSSYLPSDIIAAFLWAQLEEAESITRRRLDIWEAYHTGFSGLEERGLIRRPIVPGYCTHNAHMYYLLVEDLKTRTELIAHLNGDGIQAVFHYVPLHSSPAGRRYGRASGGRKDAGGAGGAERLPATVEASSRLVRMPLWVGLGPEGVARVVESVERFFRSGR